MTLPACTISRPFALAPVAAPAAAPSPAPGAFDMMTEQDLATMHAALAAQLAAVTNELRKRADAHRTAAHAIATTLAPRRRGWRR